MADEGISVGSVSVDVVPSAEGFGDKTRAQVDAALKPITEHISRQIADAIQQGFTEGGRGAGQSGDAAAARFAESFKARLKAAFEALPEAEINADSSEADARIQAIRTELEDLSGKTVGVDISDAEARAKVDALKAELDDLGAKSPNIQVQADTARASAELAAVAAEADAVGSKNPTVQVDVDSSGAVNGMSTLLTVIVAIGPALIPIGAAAVAGLGGIATVAAAGAAGLGVLGLAISGVAKAVGLLGQEQASAAQRAATAASRTAAAARQEASAQASLTSAREALTNAQASAAAREQQAAQQIADARRTLADVEVRTAEQIRQARERVTAAAYTETQANQRSVDALVALNNAREQATRDLQSYADAQTDANLNVTQSQIDLTNATAQYQADLADPTVSAAQREQDELNVAKATQALKEAKEQAANATADNTKAQAAGVDGAPAVISATEQMTAAQHDQQAATLALTDAQRNQALVSAQSAEQIVKAQEALSTAVRAQSDAQRQAAYSVEAAENSVANSMRAVANANATQAASSVTALSSVQQQLDATNPAVLVFATYVHDKVLPAFHELQGIAAAGLLPGVQQALTNLAPLFPPIEGFISGLAKTMGGLAASASKAFTDPFWTQFFVYVSQVAGPTLVTFSRIVGNIAKGFAGLLEAFQPITDQIGAGIEHLTRDFAAFGTGGGAGLRSFIDYIERTGPLVVETLGKIFDAIGHLLQALAPLGPIILQGLGILADVINAIPTPLLTELAVVIGTVVVALKLWAIAQAAIDFLLDANPVGLLIVAIAALAAGVIYAVTHFKIFRDVVAGVFEAVTAVVEGFVSFFTKTLPNAVLHAIDFVKDHWPLLLTIIAGPFGLAVALVVKHFDTIKNTVHDGIDAIVGFFTALPGRIKDAIVGAFDAVYDEFASIINKIIHGINHLHFTLPKFNTHIPGVGTIGGETVGFDHVPDIPLLAQGGVIDRAGWAVVGDAGPEMLYMPHGAEVHPLSSGQRIVSGASGGSSGDVTFVAQFGDETWTAIATEQANTVMDARVARAERRTSNGPSRGPVALLGR